MDLRNWQTKRCRIDWRKLSTRTGKTRTLNSMVCFGHIELALKQASSQHHSTGIGTGSSNADRISGAKPPSVVQGKTRWNSVGANPIGAVVGTWRRVTTEYLALEHDQNCQKASVNRQQKGNERQFDIGKLVLVFQTRMELMPGKLKFQWTGPYWIIN